MELNKLQNHQTLEIKNLSVGYQNALIENINIKVNSPQFIALIGENGSGKTSFIHTLLKINPIFSGEISFNGIQQNKYSAKQWAEIFSAVFSRPQHLPQISVLELLMLSHRHADKKLCDSLLVELGIESIKNQYINQISDGQLQKAMIARAILQDTPYMILDEPSAHLDFKNKYFIFGYLKKLTQKYKKTCIVITHEILYAYQYADAIWMVNNKKMVQGSVSEIEQQFNLKRELNNLMPQK